MEREKNVKRKTSKGLALLTASAVAAVTVLGTGTPAAQAAEAEYEIYPKPHEISYEGDSWILKNEVNVVYEDGIDEATQDRLDEVFALKDGITVSESDEIVEGKTNVLVGIDGSDGYVDQYAEENVEVSADGLFDKLDSYVLDSKEDVITVPSNALTEVLDGSIVYKVVDGKAVRTPVTTGSSNDTRTVITSGINPGDMIITAGTVSDGSSVNVL